MRKLLLLTFLPLLCAAQATNNEFPGFKAYGVLVGYQASFDPKKDENGHEQFKTIHLLELAVSRIKDSGGRHGSSSDYYAGTDFVLNYSGFVLGPKVGANFCASGFCLGSELAFYTDFRHVSPRFTPMIGFGGNGARIFASVPIRFYKSDFMPVNRLNLGVTIPIYSLTDKKFTFFRR